MTEKGPENLEPNDFESDEDAAEDDTRLEKPDFEEISGELASDTLKRARGFIRQLEEEVNKIEQNNEELEDKLEKGLLSEAETDTLIEENSKKILRVRDLIKSVPDMAKEQITRNKKRRQNK